MNTSRGARCRLGGLDWVGHSHTDTHIGVSFLFLTAPVCLACCPVPWIKQTPAEPGRVIGPAPKVGVLRESRVRAGKGGPRTELGGCGWGRARSVLPTTDYLLDSSACVRAACTGEGREKGRRKGGDAWTGWARGMDGLSVSEEGRGFDCLLWGMVGGVSLPSALSLSLCLSCSVLRLGMPRPEGGLCHWGTREKDACLYGLQRDGSAEAGKTKLPCHSHYGCAMSYAVRSPRVWSAVCLMGIAALKQSGWSMEFTHLDR